MSVRKSEKCFPRHGKTGKTPKKFRTHVAVAERVFAKVNSLDDFPEVLAYQAEVPLPVVIALAPVPLPTPRKQLIESSLW